MRALRRARPRHGRVKEHCILRGLAWEGTLAATACSEQEYYEDLLAFYRQIYRARSCAPSWAGGAGSWGMQRVAVLPCCFMRHTCAVVPRSAHICDASAAWQLLLAVTGLPVSLPVTSSRLRCSCQCAMRWHALS